MSSLYVFDGIDDERASYTKGDQLDKWHAHMKRSGGAIELIQNCLFCDETISHFQAERTSKSTHRPGWMLPEFEPHELIHLVLCKRCGWFRTLTQWFIDSPVFPIIFAESAVLQKKDISNADVPLEELRSHLVRNWGDRRTISAGRAEELVASVFREHLDGEIHYTTNGVFSPDGGIDFVVVQSESGVEYAFQVKRRLTDKPECVQSVRSFVGALATSKFARGYFVTMAPRFTSTTVSEMEDARVNLTTRNLRIELIDGSKLFALLRNGACRRPSFNDLRLRTGGDETRWRCVGAEDGDFKDGNSLSDLLDS